MFLAALLGGLILNLMPCVFPVLSLKLLGVARDRALGNREVRLHALLYTGGVVASFWGLAGALLVHRGAGGQVGWGFQLQSPAFIAFLIALFFLLGLNLMEVFELGTSLMGAGSGLAHGRGERWDAFMTAC